MKKWILYISIIVSIFTYIAWSLFPEGFFFIGNAFFITLICTYMFLNDRKSFIKYMLMGYSVNNLIDELFYDNTTLHSTEIAIAIIIPIIWIIKKKNARQRT